jgi:ABC-type glutathione transport system ATPase component
MHKTTTQVNSGHSGLGKSGSARILSGRKYYRNKTIWICDGCWPTYKKSKMNRRIGKLIIWSLIILSLYALL